MNLPSARKKTTAQIEAMKAVQHATEMAMEAAISYIHSAEAPTSEEAHSIIDRILAENDCESPEGHIVAGGTDSAEPHALGAGLLPSDGPIVIDIYPRSKTTGYFADMSRTVCRGTPPPELEKMFDAVRVAQDVGESMLRPGAKCSDIQEAVEKVFTDRGYITSGEGKEFKFAEGFVHGVGHGVGLNVHEDPRIGRGSADVLEEGDVVTVEPGLYYRAIGGVRLEDMLVITSTGYENLTNFSRELKL